MITKIFNFKSTKKPTKNADAFSAFIFLNVLTCTHNIQFLRVAAGSDSHIPEVRSWPFSLSVLQAWFDGT